MLTVIVPQWTIYDGERPAPAPGVIYDSCAIELLGIDGVIRAREAIIVSERPALVGTVEWVRHNVESPRLEAVLRASNFKILVRADTMDSDLFRLGVTLSIEGEFWVMGDYEFDAFELPDIRRDWKVVSAHEDLVTGNYIAELAAL